MFHFFKCFNLICKYFWWQFYIKSVDLKDHDDGDDNTDQLCLFILVSSDKV